MTPARTPKRRARTLAVVLGDQLQHDSPALHGLDPARDAVLMMEVAAESTHVPSHKQRTALFLSAMRHFAQDLRGRGLGVRYSALDDPGNTQTLTGEVARAAADLRPERIVVVQPGEHRVAAMLPEWERAAGAEVTVLPDTHFLTDPDDFARRYPGPGTRMETFYRRQRATLGVLIDKDGGPVGGAWNFDKQNRLPFGKAGPDPTPPPPLTFEPDATTREVLRLVRERFPDNPGLLERFDWPVTRAQALEVLDDFLARRLALFGPYEDAMWTGERTLYHSRLSAALNLKLLSPREVVDRALQAARRRRTPLQSIEGFVRQVIGWREFIRGVYRREGPAYGERNALDQHGALPAFYWNARTDMRCMRECLGQVVQTGYGHHIQRLMVTGNFALIAGVHPRAVSDWYLAMYVDAVDWVTLPNTLGMSQFADGGAVASKPYAASANYINRMSDYCRGCAYDPKARVGPRACPFNTFYWDFLIRNRARFARNPRMAMPLKHVDAMTDAQRVELTVSARAQRDRLGVGPIDAASRGGVAPPAWPGGSPTP